MDYIMRLGIKALQEKRYEDAAKAFTKRLKKIRMMQLVM